MAATLPDLVHPCPSSTGPASRQGVRKMNSCTRAFLKQTAKSLADDRCDPREISLLLDHIFSICREVTRRTTGRTEATRPGLQWARVADEPRFGSRA